MSCRICPLMTSFLCCFKRSEQMTLTKQCENDRNTLRYALCGHHISPLTPSKPLTNRLVTQPTSQQPTNQLASQSAGQPSARSTAHFAISIFTSVNDDGQAPPSFHRTNCRHTLRSLIVTAARNNYVLSYLLACFLSGKNSPAFNHVKLACFPCRMNIVCF